MLFTKFNSSCEVKKITEINGHFLDKKKFCSKTFVGDRKARRDAGAVFFSILRKLEVLVHWRQRILSYEILRHEVWYKFYLSFEENIFPFLYM